MRTSDYEPFVTEQQEDVTLCEALGMLADYLPAFKRPGFTLGRWVEPEVEGPEEYVVLTNRGERFVRDLHSYRWIRNFTMEDTSRSRKLHDEDDPHAFDDATPEELSQLLTGCLQLDAIQEGHLIECCDKGWLMRILQRAQALLEELSLEEGQQAML